MKIIFKEPVSLNEIAKELNFFNQIGMKSITNTKTNFEVSDNIGYLNLKVELQNAIKEFRLKNGNKKHNI